MIVTTGSHLNRRVEQEDWASWIYTCREGDSGDGDSGDGDSQPVMVYLTSRVTSGCWIEPNICDQREHDPH